MGCIYGQRVQKGRSLVRVQAISSLSGGWGEILGGCTLVRIESWSFVHQAFSSFRQGPRSSIFSYRLPLY